MLFEYLRSTVWVRLVWGASTGKQILLSILNDASRPGDLQRIWMQSHLLIIIIVLQRRHQSSVDILTNQEDVLYRDRDRS